MILFDYNIMDSMINLALRNALIIRKDLFGERNSFIGFEMQQVNLDKFHGLQSTWQSGRIIYHKQDHKTKYSDYLFLKISKPTAAMKDVSQLVFFNEMFFYTRILPFFQTLNPDIRQRFPQYYNSLLQYGVDSDRAVIVFENLRAIGYSPPEKKTFLDYHHLKLMMKKLGEFHAYSYRAREQTPDTFHAMMECQMEVIGHWFERFPCLRAGLERGLDPLTNDPHYSSKTEILRNIILLNCTELYKSALTGDKSNNTHILCHGDYISNNVLFLYEDGVPIDLKMVDLATWRFASPIVDLVMVLYLNADQKMRDENWNNLINEYYVALRDTFPTVKVPSKDSILAEFKIKAIFAYLIASYYLRTAIAEDNDDVPGQADLVPEKYKNTFFPYLPPEHLDIVVTRQGGEKTTTALANILKDIVDRGFV